MSRCKDCAKRLIYICDEFGEIPAAAIDKVINCQKFEPLADGEKELRRWLEGVPAGCIEHIYIKALIDMMELKPSPTFDQAVSWLYTLPDSKSVRAARSSVDIFPVRSPI